METDETLGEDAGHRTAGVLAELFGTFNVTTLHLLFDTGEKFLGVAVSHGQINDSLNGDGHTEEEDDQHDAHEGRTTVDELFLDGLTEGHRAFSGGEIGSGGLNSLSFHGFRSNSLFGCFWLSSCIFKAPLCAEYVKYSYGGDKADRNPLFIKTNYILAIAWGVLYLLTAVWTFFLKRAGFGVSLIILNNLVPVVMGIFTGWFVSWYPAKLARG